MSKRGRRQQAGQGDRWRSGLPEGAQLLIPPPETQSPVTPTRTAQKRVADASRHQRGVSWTAGRRHEPGRAPRAGRGSTSWPQSGERSREEPVGRLCADRAVMQALSRRVRQNASVTPRARTSRPPAESVTPCPATPRWGPLAAIFRARVERWWPDLIDARRALYGNEIGAATAAELLAIAEQSYAVRPPALHARDPSAPSTATGSRTLDDRLRGIHRADGR